MTGFNEKLFCDVVAIFCAAMTLFNLARAKARGATAFFLAGAFLSLGGTLLLYSAKGMSPWIWVGGGCVAGLLIGDIAYRAVRASRGPP